MASFLGTIWWTLLCVGGGFVGGIMMAKQVKRFLHKD